MEHRRHHLEEAFDREVFLGAFEASRLGLEHLDHERRRVRRQQQAGAFELPGAVGVCVHARDQHVPHDSLARARHLRDAHVVVGPQIPHQQPLAWPGLSHLVGPQVRAAHQTNVVFGTGMQRPAATLQEHRRDGAAGWKWRVEVQPVPKRLIRRVVRVDVGKRLVHIAVGSLPHPYQDAKIHGVDELVPLGIARQGVERRVAVFRRDAGRGLRAHQVAVLELLSAAAGARLVASGRGHRGAIPQGSDRGAPARRDGLPGRRSVCRPRRPVRGSVAHGPTR